MSTNGTLISVAGNQDGAAIAGSGRKTPKIVTTSDPFFADSTPLQVARGKVPGATPVGSFGERLALAGEVNRIIWPNGIFKLPPASGVQMSIVSTSANDAAAGTGIRTIEIHYIDSSLNQQHESVTLNGLTPVLTVATDIRFIDCMHVSSYGSTPAAASGTITASNGGVTYSQISAGDLRCTSSARMVPAGKYLYVAGAIGSSVSGTSAAKAELRIVATELDTHQYIDPLIFIPFGTIGIQDASEAFNFPVPLRFSPETVVALTVTTDKDAQVSGSWFGWFEDI